MVMRPRVKTLFGVLLVSMLAGAAGVHAQVSNEGCCDTPFKLVNRIQTAQVQLVSPVFYEGLLKRPYKEISLLKLNHDVCDTINCMGLSLHVAREYIDAALIERQIEDNSAIIKLNAESAYFGSRVALGSFIIAILAQVSALILGMLGHLREKRRDAALVAADSFKNFKEFREEEAERVKVARAEAEAERAKADKPE
ncbi:MAG TPA: hypothetical protein VIE65_08455 [Methylobacter sp.]|jgi:hypothetical protein